MDPGIKRWNALTVTHNDPLEKKIASYDTEFCWTTSFGSRGGGRGATARSHNKYSVELRLPLVTLGF